MSVLLPTLFSDSAGLLCPLPAPFPSIHISIFSLFVARPSSPLLLPSFYYPSLERKRTEQGDGASKEKKFCLEFVNFFFLIKQKEENKNKTKKDLFFSKNILKIIKKINNT